MKRIVCGGGVVLLLLACLALGESPEAAADEVKQPIKLFNGKDLTNFYTYLGSPDKGMPKYGKNNDPEKVFTVSEGMIRVSGKVYGCFVTEKEYENYHLVTEFKWGEKTWPPRDKATRDSGILLHCVGEDGGNNYDKTGKPNGVWLESVECQMIEGGTGDFILVSGKGKPRLTVTAEQRPTGAKGTRKEWYYNPKAPAKEFVGGRINWYGRDPLWTDTLGFRGKDDVEHPVGQWNKLECICEGGSITNILNGKVVNHGTNCSHTKGKILFQSEGAEVFFRTIELHPLKKR